MGWPRAKLGDVVSVQNKLLNPQKFPDTQFIHFSIPAFDEGRQPKVEPGAAIKSSKIRFESDTVLFSKLNPRINRVWLVSEKHDQPMLCSTEFISLKPKADRITADYLAWTLRSPAVVDGFQKQSHAATKSRERIHASEVLQLEIAVPPLPEQRRLVDILDRAEAIRVLRRQATTKVKEIIPALYADMFGGTAVRAQDWPVKMVGEIATVVRGSSPRPQGDPRYFGGPVPRLMIADITRDGTYVTPQIDSLTELGATKSRSMLRGSVVMAVSGAVGLPAILSIDACIHDGFVGFRELSPDIIPEYFYWFLNYQRHVAVHEAVGAIFQNLTTDQTKRWRVPIPPRHLQLAFLSRARAIDGYSRLADQACGSVENLRFSLLNQVQLNASR